MIPTWFYIIEEEAVKQDLTEESITEAIEYIMIGILIFFVLDALLAAIKSAIDN